VNPLQQFFLVFLPLFVAIDVFGTLPMFLSITEGETEPHKRTIAGEASLTAMIVGTLFLFAGQAIMRFLGITINDFRVAGGIILLCFAVYDLLFSHLQRSISEQSAAYEMEGGGGKRSLAIVPLGVPLVVGPAALTAVLLLAAEYGPILTVLAFGLNILIVYLFFAYSGVILKRIPKAVLRAVSKVVALFLAAIAVMMVRTGLALMFAKGQ
jgi:multiple antibiotic resistance protein